MLRFLDTDTCVAYLRGTSVRVRDRLLKQSRSTIALPAIVMAELLFGLEKSTQRKQRDSVIQQFVRAFRIVPFTEIPLIARSQPALAGPFDMVDR